MGEPTFVDVFSNKKLHVVSSVEEKKKRAF